MELQPRRIEALHDELQRGIGGSLGFVIGIGPSTDISENWKKVQSQDVHFLFRTADQRSITEYSLRESGTSCPVVRLPPTLEGRGPIAWASWYEQWRPLGEKKFRLLKASWTFFWGPEARTARQLFRAEWDNPGPDEAPQPHWNIDAAKSGLTRTSTEETGAVAISEARTTGLYAAAGPQELVETRFPCLHFVMGGWTHSPVDAFPQSIRCGLDQRLFARWASTTLQHVCTELGRLADAG